jgi:hypothetical protein
MPDIRRQLAAHGGLHSIADLARRWGVSKQRARELTMHPDFPKPILTAGGDRLWLASEADQFRNRK